MDAVKFLEERKRMYKTMRPNTSLISMPFE